MGKGQLRYKFKTQTVVFQGQGSFEEFNTKALTRAKFRVTAAPSSTSHSSASSSPRSLNSDVSSLADSFTQMLQLTDNPQYDLTCLGDWFATIPQRLGTSPALDSAAAAFIAGLRGVRRGGEHSVSALVQYGKAISSLRDTIAEPERAKSPHTLCAIFMMLIAQGWFDKQTTSGISHMEGITHILNASAGEKWDDGFDTIMRLNMIYPASVEAILNPNIKVDPWYLKEWHPVYGPYRPLDKECGQPIESLDVPSVLNFPKYTREPYAHEAEMKTTYTRLKAEVAFSLKRVHMMEGVVAAAEHVKTEQMRALIQLETAYGLLVCYALVLNALLTAMDPFNGVLEAEGMDMAKQAIAITESAADHLPLGTGCTPITLFGAWLATDDEEIVAGIVRAMTTVEVRYIDWTYVRRIRELKHRVRQIRQETLESMTGVCNLPGDVLFGDGLYDSMVFDWALPKAAPS